MAVTRRSRTLLQTILTCSRLRSTPAERKKRSKRMLYTSAVDRCKSAPSPAKIKIAHDDKRQGLCSHPLLCPFA